LRLEHVLVLVLGGARLTGSKFGQSWPATKSFAFFAATHDFTTHHLGVTPVRWLDRTSRTVHRHYYSSPLILLANTAVQPFSRRPTLSHRRQVEYIVVLVTVWTIHMSRSWTTRVKITAVSRDRSV
jgi:hypothetical protein